MLRKLLLLVIVLGVIGLGAFWFLTTPRTFAASALPSRTPDLANGEYMFNAGGCASCHAQPATDDCARPGIKDAKLLPGGRCLHSPFGTFYAPNISPDPNHGIGGWSTVDFVNAMKYGVGPDGTHYYPAFPYTSYQKMTFEDLIDLKAYIDTLQPVATDAPEHDVPFPFNVRRGLGLWQLLYVDGETFRPDASKSAAINRGAYLVEGPGHCTQCHSPRNFFGGIIASEEFSGGVAPDGEGVPNITPHPDTGIGKWKVGDFSSMVLFNLTPSGDAPGREMADVVQNLSKLTGADQDAMAEYLLSLPPRESNAPAKAAPSS